MILANDLLLLLVTVMHISSTASNPVRPTSCEEKLCKQAEKNKWDFRPLLKDLKYAENLFIERLFYNTTSETKTRSLKPLGGITINMTNSDIDRCQTLNSMSEISACLTSYLPKVIGNLITHEDVKTNIISHTRTFKVPVELLAAEMKDCWKEGELKVCPNNLANNQTGYEMREHALGVLHTAVKWTESYIAVNWTESCINQTSRPPAR